jgi:flagella basal body P-ring formation protein FlgA
VADLPSIGRTRTVSAFRLRNVLRQHGFERVTIQGLQSTVSVETRQLGRAEIEALIRDWVEGEAPEDADVELSYLSIPSCWKVPAGEDIDLVVDARMERIAGQAQVALRAKCGQRVLTSSSARIELKLYRECTVLGTPLMRGQRLSKEHLVKERCEIGQSSKMEVTDPQYILGMTAKRNLGAGVPLKLTDFELPDLIERGSRARIMVMNGDVNLGISGAEALQSGKKGEHILFKNPLNPRNNLRAEVIRPGLAVIRVR